MELEDVNGVQAVEGVNGVKVVTGSQRSRKSNGRRKSKSKLRDCRTARPAVTEFHFFAFFDRYFS